MNSMISELKDLADVIYNTKPPTKDEMLITLYLHTMADGNFDWLQKIKVGSMTSTSMKLSPDEITRHLELEAQEA